MALIPANDDPMAVRLATLHPLRTSTWMPTVSIVIRSQGEEHLKSKLLAGLKERTSYSNTQIVLVDDGSKDLDRFAGDERWAETILVNSESSRSSAHAINLGIAEATGELVLLAHHSIDPINPGWLGHMVDTLEQGAAVVGAMLVQPEQWTQTTQAASHDLVVQHLGLAFERDGDAISASAIGFGDNPLAAADLAPRQVAAVTTACLLSRRSDLIAVGGFDERYSNDPGAWDLCFRLAGKGPVVVEPKAVLLHHRQSVGDNESDDGDNGHRSNDHRLFLMTWGPPLLRRMLLERLDVSPRLFSTERKPTVVFIVDDYTSGDGVDLVTAWHAEAGDAGWDSQIANDPPDEPVDLLITTTPRVNRLAFERSLLSIAVPFSDLESWTLSGTLDAVDVILAASETQKATIDATFAPASAVRIDTHGAKPTFDRVTAAVGHTAAKFVVAVTTCVPDEPRIPFWGDTYFGRSLGRGFAELGVRYRDLIQPEWPSLRFGACDTTIHLRGIEPRSPWPGQRNALWFISHPSRLVEGECDGFDVIASASRSHAQLLGEQLGREVLFLPQATDPHVFSLGPRSVDLEADVLFVGSSRIPHRKAPRWLHRSGIDFHLYGKNWDTFPEASHLRAEFFPNKDLGTLYRSARIVVADHHPDMRAHGIVANRIFDILACGGFVISDDVAGLNELLDGAVPVYTSKDELANLVHYYLKNPAERRRLSAIGRRRVLDSHTFKHRAATLLGGLRPDTPSTPIPFADNNNWPVPMPPAHIPHTSEQTEV